MWITDEKPKYFEGIPVGDYILEELETPVATFLHPWRLQWRKQEICRALF